MSNASLRTGTIVLAVLFSGACTSAPIERDRAIPREATVAVSQGYAALLARPERTEEAKAHLRRARLLAPDWVAPLRLLDDIERNRLLGVEALRAHRLALERDPSDAAEAYLAGRLEGQDGARRFREAVRFDPRLSWGWHGLAQAEAGADSRAALEHARRAVALARDPWERAYFTNSLAKLLAAGGRESEVAALDLLDDAARGAGFAERERNSLEVAALEIGLASSLAPARERAYERGLTLLRQADPSDSELESLVSRMQNGLYVDDLGGRQLALALASRPGATRERLRADIVSSPLSRMIGEETARREGRERPAGARARTSRFPSSNFAETIEMWRAQLPRVVVDEAGDPRSPRLAAVVNAARALDGTPEEASVESLARLGTALIDAGWFRECQALVARLARRDPARALELENRALAGSSILDGLVRIARRTDERTSRPPDPSGIESEASRSLRTLDDFLGSIAPLFAHAAQFLSGERDEARVRESVLASPRMEYAGVAELVHPGPVFSLADEASGLGRQGDLVGGLAPLFASIGRFAVVGRVAGGGGPDAGVLPLLWLEWRSGEHLGVPWQGTVAWCEAADLKSRAARAGAQISAAALHEGYWVDVDAVREEVSGWNALRRRLLAGPNARAEVETILGSKGFALGPRADERERRSTRALLGEAHRVRLAVMRELARDDQVLGEVTLDAMLTATAIHEEGHLCDRTRFLPIWEHKLAILRFLLQCNFSPRRVAEELEYRAQLVCLCDAPDPRLPLAQVLDAGESTSPALTPHGPGYQRLLDDLVRVMDELVEVDAAVFPTIDRQHTLVHQLHRLGASDVRRLARELARRKGL